MKKLVIVSFLLIAAVTVFAAGEQEAASDDVVKLQPRGMEREDFISDLEKIEISGTVKYESPVAELVSGGVDYTLTAPGLMHYGSYVTEGQQLTVKGRILPEGGMMGRMSRRKADFSVLEGNTVILVESVVVDGTEYQLPWVDGENFERAGGRFGKGGASGRMGGMHGRGFGGHAEGCPYYN